MAIFERNQGHYDLFYSVREGYGEQPETIVFIHGLGYSSAIWQSLMDRLDTRYRLITYDLCGHGQSGMTHDSISWPLFYEELFDLLDFLEVSSCHLFGHGIGGIIAIKAAVARGKRLKSLTLMSTPLYFPEDLYKYEYDQRLDLLVHKRSEFAHHMALNVVHQMTPAKRHILETAFRMVDERMYIDGVGLSFRSTDSFMTDLRNIKLPTLVMGGELDPVFPVNYTAVYSNFLEKSRLRIIPNASNAAFMDEPDYVAKSLVTFIQERDRLYFSKSHEYLQNKINSIFEKGQLAEREEATLHVKVINTFSIQWRKKEIRGKWNQRFAKELFLFLMLKHRVTREEIIVALLPETPVDKAKSYLRVMINHLKHILIAHGDPYLADGLVADRQFVHLDLPVNSDLNNYLKSIDDFEDLPAERQLETLIQLIRQYRDTFMPGFEAPWITSLKSRIENQLGHFMVDLSDAYHEAGDDESAILLLIEGVTVEPYEGYCDDRIEEIKGGYRPAKHFSPPIG
ncbi:pimeloyl-ACP methyl ester carboxylesterase [Pullulanibacillus pueri]|uniref:AB hydrolase-1 domain-containing protein n=1 Tax=Pullulanibacillus pueri TaxID=1437324 RepID=A0A8J2ZXW8_9BACL|nr:alpha/beta hydrolase [Pullulanibacillus pueri]MBM7681771.1 pimeloyl-ACP methyl ester carboxylesterase [Pullulanibacillus pueri]GGH84194.1 hypothetical protein GCM10007096_26710 [Pullulanibacillus pueri]